MRVHHYSISTERSYIQWIRRLIYFHNKRHLEDMRPMRSEPV
ncbi:phage integrase N-terminal SAM-like domain-containing protein [Sulfuriflexus sp.]|nr:phage integrase N-terminal SAM-like domain-containing protein [Sulfuriflexus sp.]MDT8405028.1 phage integrase N-terminal SAM-like domain-containing protein [Sulfuriflexus sp.]